MTDIWDQLNENFKIIKKNKRSSQDEESKYQLVKFINFLTFYFTKSVKNKNDGQEIKKDKHYNMVVQKLG
jgi:hypothetical protein